ncbi:MAG: hypothetical protein DRG71_09200 [Deltaproteobacteria bacterium]|nr:MAG: hypothetical protein DRG71_09200 [Deltaproteobacteria bacterium]HHD15656.1 hypothetical protein [Euryarchaeota archaeon]
MLKITPPAELVELKGVCSSVPDGRADMVDHLMKELFPLMDFDTWVGTVVQGIPEGYATTFGTISRSLGTETASRAVGSFAAAGRRDVPCHRIVYSDGSVPPSSVDLLAGEMELVRKGDVWFAPGERIIRHITFEPSPFGSLSLHQELMRGLLDGNRHDFGLIAGIDISSRNDTNVCAVCTFTPDGESVGEICHRGGMGIPYVSGFLFYREAPLMIPAVIRAEENGFVDGDTLLVIDGNGALHPRRMGLASEVGTALGMKSCGVAKKLIMGTLSEWRELRPGEYISSVTVGDEVLGKASRTGSGSPIYISTGWGTDLRDVTTVLISLKRGRLPLPVKRAHELANRCRRSEPPSGHL